MTLMAEERSADVAHATARGEASLTLRTISWNQELHTMTKEWFRRQVTEVRRNDPDAVVALCQLEAPGLEPFDEWLHGDEEWDGRMPASEWGMLQAPAAKHATHGVGMGPDYISGCTKINVCGYIRLKIFGPKGRTKLQPMRSQRTYKGMLNIPQLKGGVTALLRVDERPPVAVVCTHAPTKRKDQLKFYRPILEDIPKMVEGTGWDLGAVFITGDLNHRLAIVDAPDPKNRRNCEPFRIHGKCKGKIDGWSIGDKLLALQEEMCRLLDVQADYEDVSHAHKLGETVSSAFNMMQGAFFKARTLIAPEEEAHGDGAHDSNSDKFVEMDISKAQRYAAELLADPAGRECLMQFDSLDGPAVSFDGVPAQPLFGSSDYSSSEGGWSSWTCKSPNLHEQMPGYSLDTEASKNAKECWKFAPGPNGEPVKAGARDVQACFDTLGKRKASKALESMVADKSGGGFMKDRQLSVGWLDRTCEAHDAGKVTVERTYELLDHSTQRELFRTGESPEAQDELYFTQHHSDHTVLIVDTKISYK